MVEQFDAAEAFLEIKKEIEHENYHAVVSLTDKILKHNSTDNEAQQVKLIALINDGKFADCINFIAENKLEQKNLLEFAYCLYETKQYKESIAALKDRTEDVHKLLVAQNLYKLENFRESYEIYKTIFDERERNKKPLEEDLVTNLIAAYSFIDHDEEITSVTQHLNSWEAFYNYSIYCLKRRNYKSCLETMREMDDLNEDGDDFNETKSLSLSLTLIQEIVSFFDFSKTTNIQEKYEKVFAKNRHPQLMPYFFNNYIALKKDKSTTGETIKKLEKHCQSENLLNKEKEELALNKVILILRANKMQEAEKEFEKLTPNLGDVTYLLVKLFLLVKSNKLEDFEKIVEADENLRKSPECHLATLQVSLNNLNNKSIDKFHVSLISFIDKFYSISCNYDFISFFIGVYKLRHKYDKIKELVAKYPDPTVFAGNKKCLTMLGDYLYASDLYKEALAFYREILSKDPICFETKLRLINCLAFIDTDEADKLRHEIDTLNIDISEENIDELLSDVVAKFRKGQEKVKEKKKKKKKIRHPKNFDAKNPGPMPDPERWLPKLQRKKYRGLAKKLAQGAASVETTTKQSGAVVSNYKK